MGKRKHRRANSPRTKARAPRRASNWAVSPGQERVLETGIDYSTWAEMKVRRAHQLTSELLSSVELHRASMGCETRVSYSDDRKAVTFLANIPNAAPVAEWSLIFGDIVHNYRSALDALAWRLAHLDGAVPDPKVAKRIAFPFAQTRTDWEQICKGPLASVPSFVLHRLDAVQPYHRDHPDEGVGVLLHALDIEDKHREALQVDLIADDRTAFLFTTEFEEPGEYAVTNEEWLATGGPLKDGDPVLRLTASNMFKDARLSTLPLQLTIKMSSGNKDALWLLNLIDAQVAASFIVVAQGHESREWHETARAMVKAVGRPALPLW